MRKSMDLFKASKQQFQGIGSRSGGVQTTVRRWVKSWAVAAGCAICVSSGFVAGDFTSPASAGAALVQFDDDEPEQKPAEKKEKQSARLVENWRANISTTITRLGAFPVKVVLPSSSHAAFQITADTPIDQIPETLELVVKLKSKAGNRTFSSRQIGSDGKPLGIEGVRTQAEIQTTILESRGFKVEKSEKYLPMAFAFGMTKSGTIQAMSAETGRVAWVHRLREVSGPVLGFDVSEKYVAAVQGNTLVVLEAASGDEVDRIKLRVIPSDAPVITDQTVTVVGVRGVVESVKVNPTGDLTSKLGGYGGSLTQGPTNIGEAVMWGAENSLYISNSLNPTTPLFRIPCDPLKISYPSGYSQLVVVSNFEGKLSCFSQTSGRHFWDGYFENRLVGIPYMLELDPAMVPKSQMIESLTPTLKVVEEKKDAGEESAGDEEEGDIFGDDSSSDDGGDDIFGEGSDSESVDEEEEGEDSFSKIGKNVSKRVNISIEEIIGKKKVVRALVTDKNGKLIAVDLKTGQRINSFSARGIKQVLGQIDSAIIALASDGSILSLDKISGRVLERYRLAGEWKGIPNYQSDRIYLQNKLGQVVCLRPESSPLPVYKKPKNLIKFKVKGKQEKKAAEEGEAEEDEGDIFGN